MSTGAIVVTGATGFLGAHVVRTALAAGDRVIAVRRDSATRIPDGTHGALWVDGDLQRVAFDREWSASTLVHLAAHGVIDRDATWEDCFRTNVSSSIAVWERAHAAGVRRFIVCGSCFEYGLAATRYRAVPPDATLEPIGPYAVSKAAASLAAASFAIEREAAVAILRPFHLFGEGEASSRFWPSLQAAARSGRDLAMTAGEQVRDFVPVEFAAAHFVAAARTEFAPARATVLNIGTGVPRTLRDFAEEWWARSGASGRLKLGEVPYRPNEIMRYVPDISETLATLGRSLGSLELARASSSSR